MFGRCLAGALLFATLTQAAFAEAQGGTKEKSVPARLPTAAFAHIPEVRQPRLSPAGDKLLARLRIEGKEQLGIHDLATGHLHALRPPAKSEIAYYRWAGDTRILVSIASIVPWFGSEARMTRLILFDLTTGEARFIGLRDGGLVGDDVLYVDPAGEWILLSVQKTIYDWPSVYRVDLATNAFRQIVRPQYEVWDWYADDAGVVRAGIGYLDKSWFLVYRKTADEAFRRVGKARYDDDEAALDLLRFARESDEGFILSNRKTGRYAVHKYNFATRELGEVVFESPTNDVTDFELSEDGRSVRAVWYTEDRDRVAWFDEEMKRNQADLDAALPNRTNRIVSRSRDGKRMLVWTGSANDPGGYYIFIPEAGGMKRIAKVNAQLDSRQLAPTRYIHYSARDGLSIPAYLTLPPGRPAKGLPLIIMPHGGPYGVRDRLEFDGEVQFLANRGYAVLQPNYRGSEGYGDAFYKSGEGQWGRQMQDDLDDGMDWLVKEGTVDAGRVCIVGSSYGGYAALWGATRNPERYRCAASLAGVSDLKRQLDYQTDFLIDRRYRRDWRTTVQGQKDFDLDSVSPLKQIERLSVPLLIAHGDDDQRVPYKQSSLYAKALQAAGKPHEFHSYAGEGHSLESEENMRDWLDRLEAFLAKYNPAD